MAKNGHNANAIAHAKYSLWLEKTANIGKMRAFLDWPKMATMRRL